MKKRIIALRLSAALAFGCLALPVCAEGFSASNVNFILGH